VVVPQPVPKEPMAVQFDDQRPESAAQLKMQGMANASAQVFQLQALQEMADESPQVKDLNAVQLMANKHVIQLELAKNTLNVVGEDHNVSGGERRVIEKAYSEDYTGGGYWKENEFKISDNGKEFTADPTSHRFLTALHQISKLSDFCRRAYDFGRFRSVTATADARYAALAPLLELAEKLWAETSDPQYPGSLSAENMTVMRERYAQLQKFKKSLGVLRSMKGQQPNPASSATAKLHYQSIANARIIMMQNMETEANLNKSRSRKMHDAAQSNSTKKGVWKIGESHVTDIKENLGLIYPRLYNLVTEDEFEDDLLADPQLQNIVENPTPAEARDRGLYDKKKGARDT
jgi:hypothetical protein